MKHSYFIFVQISSPSSQYPLHKLLKICQISKNNNSIYSFMDDLQKLQICSTFCFHSRLFLYIAHKWAYFLLNINSCFLLSITCKNQEHLGGITGLNQAPLARSLAKFISLYRQQGRDESIQLHVTHLSTCQQTESLPYTQTNVSGRYQDQNLLH